MLSLFEGPLAPENTLRFLEAKCHAGVFSWDLMSRAVQWSPGLFVLLGMEPGTVNPSHALFESMVHPDDRQSRADLDIRIDQGLPFKREFRIIQHDGRMRWLSAHCEFVLDATGFARKMVGVVTDVTRRHEADQNLLAGRMRFRDLVMGVAPIVWVATSEGQVTATVGWAEVTGRPDSDALGMGWTDALHPEDREATIAAWREAIDRGQFFEEEYRVAQYRGGYRWYRTYAVPMIARDSRVREWNGLTVDINASRPADHNRRPPLATGAQIRASRAILKWSVNDLCEASGVSPAIIRRLEDFDGASAKSEGPVEAIRKALVEAGVEFVFSQDGNPGVRPAAIRDERRNQETH